MPDAVKSETTDRDTLRKMCAIRGIEYHPAHRAPALQVMIDQYEELNAPPGDLKDQVEVANPGFSSDKPQTPEWGKGDVQQEIREPEPLPEREIPGKTMDCPLRPAAAETFTPSKREIPANVADALKWLGAYSIGRTNLIVKYIESLL